MEVRSETVGNANELAMQRLSSSRGVSIPTCHRTRALQFHNAEHHNRGQGHKHVRKRRQDYSRRTDLTHRVGALLPTPSCLGIGGHTGGFRQGHPPDKSAHIMGRPWVAHNKLHATPPTRQNQDYRDTPWLPTSPTIGDVKSLNKLAR